MTIDHPGPRALTALLTAALLVPAARPLLGRSIPAPFEVDRWVVASAMAILLGGVLLRGYRILRLRIGGSGWRILALILAEVAALAALASILDSIVARRATAFLTPQVVADIMAVLFGLHLAGAMFPIVGAGDQPPPTRLRSPLARRMREHVTAHRLEGAAAACVAGFWVLLIVAQRELGAALLMIAGALLLTAIPVRIADAWSDARARVRRIAGRRALRGRFRANRAPAARG